MRDARCAVRGARARVPIPLPPCPSVTPAPLPAVQGNARRRSPQLPPKVPVMRLDLRHHRPQLPQHFENHRIDAQHVQSPSPRGLTRRDPPAAPSAGRLKDAQHRCLLAAAARSCASVLEPPEHGATMGKPSEYPVGPGTGREDHHPPRAAPGRGRPESTSQRATTGRCDSSVHDPAGGVRPWASGDHEPASDDRAVGWKRARPDKRGPPMGERRPRVG
jgi:hypothetical protein